MAGRALLNGLIILGILSAAEQSRDFTVPNHGALRIQIPNEWVVRSSAISQPAGATIHVSPKEPGAFDIQITIVRLDEAAMKKTTSETVQKTTAASGDSLAAQSVEKTATLKELKGSQSVGWYYSLTDRSPGPGEFKYLTQGSFLTGELLCAFTVLHRDPASPEVSQALKAFADAVHVR